MNNIVKTKHELLSYIAQKQVAFQFGDGLISFTKPGLRFDSSDFELDLPNCVEQMKSHISNASSINIVDMNYLLDDKIGFAEFASWSKESDTLILVDDCLLICIPESIDCKA